MFLEIVCNRFELSRLLPESIRWLHTKGKVEKVNEVFVKMAKMNKTEDKLQNVLNSLQAPESAGM